MPHHIPRLIYLSSSTVPSATANSIQVMKTCEALARSGYQVSLFAQVSGDGDPFQVYACARCFNLLPYPDRDRLPLPFALGRRLADAAFRRQIERVRPDILFARSARWLLRTLATPAARQASAVALELHTPPASPDVAALLHELLRNAPTLRLIVITEQLRRRMLEVMPRLRPEAITVVPDAADPALATGPVHALGPGFHLGYAGSLYPGCGLDTIGQAIAGLEDVVLHVVGGTAEEIARWQTLLPRDAAVIWHGRVPYGEVGLFLRGFDAVVAPYRADAEGHAGVHKGAWMSPLKIFEAMAAGRAILVSNLPVLREVLEDDVTAHLLPAEDPASWRAAIVAMRDQPARRQRLAATAQEDFARRYSWDARAQRILTTLRQRPVA